VQQHLGRFELASKGTIFLDEIGELPPDMQVALLRVLQDQTFERVGGTRTLRSDARVIAATNRDLMSMIATGAFREDLYYRLNVLSIKLPPLRDRREDIPLLVDHFVQRMNARMGLAISGVSPEAMRHLIESDWPGNVRELENTVERAMVLSDGPHIDVDSLPDRLRLSAGPAPPAIVTPSDDDLSIKKASRRSEADLIHRALVRTNGNRTRAAELLEISHRALLYKIKEYGITIPKEGDIPPPPTRRMN
jgi:two-component system response regulator AtoC